MPDRVGHDANIRHCRLKPLRVIAGLTGNLPFPVIAGLTGNPKICPTNPDKSLEFSEMFINIALIEKTDSNPMTDGITTGPAESRRTRGQKSRDTSSPAFGGGEML